LSTLRYFENEFIAHIQEKRCPAGKCRALITYEVVADLCRGCAVCARECPNDAIMGVKGEAQWIDPDICKRCGLCQGLCNFSAIIAY
jgi:NADP-reducing hydrogenase subunit HndC